MHCTVSVCLYQGQWTDALTFICIYRNLTFSLKLFPGNPVGIQLLDSESKGSRVCTCLLLAANNPS